MLQVKNRNQICRSVYNEIETQKLKKGRRERVGCSYRDGGEKWVKMKLLKSRNHSDQLKA